MYYQLDTGVSVKINVMICDGLSRVYSLQYEWIDIELLQQITPSPLGL